MTRIDFPNPAVFPGVDGIVFIGGELTLENLTNAYRKGIFPWPAEGFPMLWHCPEERGVIDFHEFHVPKSLKKLLKSNKYQHSFNQRFNDVIRACARQKRKDQEETWILPTMVEAYSKLHHAGHAHSVEIWNRDKQLVGGLYGVFIGGVFCGESIFHKEPNAGKVALVFLIERLQQLGLEWIDIQMVTPTTQQFGGKYIPKSEFLNRLHKAVKQWPDSINL